jgi:hypothetical protein
VSQDAACPSLCCTLRHDLAVCIDGAMNQMRMRQSQLQKGDMQINRKASRLPHFDREAQQMARHAGRKQ